MTSSAPSALTRVLLTTGFVVLRVFLAGAGGTLFDFFVGAAIRVRLGADPSVLSGEAGRLFRGLDATPGAGLITGLVEAARDERLRDIICGGSMGKKSDGEKRRVKSINTSGNFDHVDYALLFIILNQFQIVSRLDLTSLDICARLSHSHCKMYPQFSRRLLWAGIAFIFRCYRWNYYHYTLRD